MGSEAWLALLGVIVAGGATSVTWARRAGVVAPVIAGLSVQGVVSLGLFLFAGLWAPDALVYDLIGQEFAAYWGGGPTPSLVSDGKEAFPMMLGAVYFVVGHAPAIGLAINWVSHGLLIVTMAALARRADLPVRTSAWLVALVPPMVFWSSWLLRESITWLLMAAFLYALVGISRRLNALDASVMVGALVALMWFRGTAAILLAGAGMAAMVLTSGRRTILPRLGVVALALLVLSPRLKALLAGYTTIDGIEEKRSLLTDTAGTSFDPAIAGGTRGDDGVWASVLDSAVRVAFGPYPWEWAQVGAPFALDAIVWLGILGFAAVGWWHASNRRELLVLVLPALALTAALMITSGNYGTMQRLRVQTSVLIIPIAAAGLSVAAANVRARRAAKDLRRAPTEPTAPPR